MGQYIQEGQRNLFEAVVNIKDTGATVAVPHDEANVDGLDFLTGKTLEYINHMAFKGAAMAHVDGGVPNMILDVDKRDAYHFGYMVY